MRGLLALLSLALAAPASAAVDGPPAPPTVLLLPLSNSSAEPGASRRMTPAVIEQIGLRGFRVINSERVEAALAAHRIRHTDSLSRADALALSAALDGDLLMVGRVLSLREAPVPQVGLTLRLLDPASGEVIWSRMHCRMGTHYRGMLGLGEVRDLGLLIRLTLAEALSTLSVDAATGQVRADLDGDVRRQLLAPDPVAYVRRGPALDRVRTLGILPLANRSRRQGADAIVRDILIARLWATGRYRVMEPGELREQILRRGLFPTQVAGPDVLGALREELGLDAILGGSVLQFVDGNGSAALVEPQVEVAMRMVSTEGGKILWDALHRRRGEDAVSFYDAGRIPTIDRLARAAIDDLLAGLLRRSGGSR